MSIAWVFPGQGSQKVGMADPILSLDDAEARFSIASQMMGRDLLAICKGHAEPEDTPTDLNNTLNTQPALFVVESLLVDELKRQGRQASLVAGHSLGELVALYAAEVFDFTTGLKLMLRRSELMANAGGGSMTAVIGFDRDELNELIAATNDVVIANDNSSGQVVISGKPEAVNTISSNLTCKLAAPLPVSGAFHSPFMADASTTFAKELDQVIFQQATIPVMSNTDPNPTKDGELLKQRLKNQMTKGVRWREAMDLMAQSGITRVIEIGPGKVLSNLIKRAHSEISTSQLSSASDLGH